MGHELDSRREGSQALLRQLSVIWPLYIPGKAKATATANLDVRNGRILGCGGQNTAVIMAVPVSGETKKTLILVGVFGFLAITLMGSRLAMRKVREQKFNLSE